MAKPVLLLDIDGVLAPFGGDYADTHFMADTHTPSGGYVFLRHDLPEMIQRLMQHYTLMWGTAWEDRANQYMLEHIGLEDPLEFINFTESIAMPLNWSEQTSWKLPWIEKFLNEDERPAVWIDDEIREDAHNYADLRTLEGKNTLFIQTDPAIGFIDTHLDQLEKWADEQLT